MRGWKNAELSLELLLPRLEAAARELGWGGYPSEGPPGDRGSCGNLDDDLADELAEERLFDFLTDGECKCRH